MGGPRPRSLLLRHPVLAVGLAGVHVAVTLAVAVGGCADVIGADFEGARARDGLACDPRKPFGAPGRLPISDLFFEPYGPRLSPDQLTLYFTSASDEYVATRATVGEHFSKATAMTSINSAAADMAPSITADGLTYFLETTRSGPDIKIYTASRRNVADDFSPPAPVDEVNSPAPGVSDIQPYVVPDGSALYFASTRIEERGYDLYRAARDPVSGRFRPPTPLSTLSSYTWDLWPVTSPDELTIYFASSRFADEARGSVDVFTASRTSSDRDFDLPTPLVEVNSADADFPSWISPDGCTLYLTRAPGNAMYVATRGRGVPP